MQKAGHTKRWSQPIRAPPFHVWIGKEERMVYQKAKEKQKWDKWKNKEEQDMREYGVNEDVIRQLRVYDEQSFNTDRRIRQRQVPLRSCLLENAAVYPSKDINSIADLLDETENERLLHILQQEDTITLLVLLLKTMGYSIHEISGMLMMREKTIYSRMDRLRKKINKF